jgi:hypothetical protein
VRSLQHRREHLELAMTMVDLQFGALEHASVCETQRDYIADHNHRKMLRMMRQLWNAFAKDFENLTKTQILAEFESLSELHTRVLVMTRPTLH